MAWMVPSESFVTRQSTFDDIPFPPTSSLRQGGEIGMREEGSGFTDGNEEIHTQMPG
jgi:hypothetical protein